MMSQQPWLPSIIPDMRFLRWSNRRRRGGRPGIVSQLLGAFPDFWLNRLARYHSDDAVIVEVRFGGTHRGVWAGIAPTGNRMEVQSACIFVFEGDNLVCEKVYFDHATILRQLGALP